MVFCQQKIIHLQGKYAEIIPKFRKCYTSQLIPIVRKLLNQRNSDALCFILKFLGIYSTTILEMW